MDFPTSPQEITPAWLTKILRQKIGLDTFTVISLEIEPFDDDAGMTSWIARISLQYDRPAPQLPRSVIGKFPLVDPKRDKPVGRRSSANSAEREVRFYEEIAPLTDLRTPQCYFGAFEKTGGGYLLLLEDLGAWRLLRDEAMTFECAAILIEQLARFHAQWWNRPQVLDMAWLPLIDHFYSQWPKTFPAYVSTFMDKYSQRLPADFAEISRQLLAALSPLAARETDSHVTIMHADYCPNNLFARNATIGPEFAIIDWNTAFRGNGALDVAYFILRSLPTTDRRNWESQLLERYHAHLVDYGVTDYPFDDFRTHYRWELLAGFMRNIIVSSRFEPAQNPDQVDLYLGEYMPRYQAAFYDHHLGQLGG